MGREDKITIEGAKLAFRNFGGRERPFNKAGDRNFAIMLDPATADLMTRNGWNVKTTKERPDEEGYEPRPYIQVTVSFKNKPPRIILLTSKGRTPIDEGLVDMLDFSEILEADVTLNPYDWAVNGNSGRKAYLELMYVRIYEDPLDLKYWEDQEADLEAGVAD